MANTKIVIEMPEEKFNTIKSDLYNTFPAEMKEWGLEAIRNGTPLCTSLYETVTGFADRCRECGAKYGKLLKRGSCGDTISRREALESIKNLYPDMPVIDYIGARRKWLEKYAPYFECENAVEQLPPVNPQESRWIPVSERLPEDRDWYLGIFKEPDTGWINPLPFICDYVGRKTRFTTKEHWILRGFTDRGDEHITNYYFNLECVKWMPLPKSYEPQESEESDADRY